MTDYVKFINNSKEVKSSHRNLNAIFRGFLVILKMESSIVNFLKDLQKEKIPHASSNDPDEHDSINYEEESNYFCIPTYNIVDAVVKFLNLREKIKN